MKQAILYLSKKKKKRFNATDLHTSTSLTRQYKEEEYNEIKMMSNLRRLKWPCQENKTDRCIPTVDRQPFLPAHVFFIPKPNTPNLIKSNIKPTKGELQQRNKTQNRQERPSRTQLKKNKKNEMCSSSHNMK